MASPWRIIKKEQYTLHILEGAGWDEHDDNIDIEVHLLSGKRYSASLFTVKNLQTLMDRHQITGESNHGQYIYTPDMIIVRRLTVDIIVAMIDDLLKSGSFKFAFNELVTNQH